MRKLLAIAVIGSRVAVILAIVAALAISGAGAAERLFRADQQEPKEQPTAASHAELMPTADSEEPASGMAHSSKPCTEQGACFQSVVVLPWGGEQHRAPIRDVCTQHNVPSSVAPLEAEFSPRTSGEVHSALGRQFTLVGARPSGTS